MTPQEYTELIKSIPLGFFLKAEHHQAIEGLLGGDPVQAFKMGEYKLPNGRRVKGLFVHRSGKRPFFLSKRVLFKKTPPSKRSRVLKAMREAIHSQIAEFREQNPQVVCAHTKKTLSKSEAHVDHIVPFISLAEAWSKENGLDFEDISLDRKGHIKDKAIAKSWYDYHTENAKLQWLSAVENLKKSCYDSSRTV